MDRTDRSRPEPRDHLAHVVRAHLEVAERADHREHAGDGPAEPLHPVERVALVEQHTAALLLLGHVEGSVVLPRMPQRQVHPREAPRGDDAPDASGIDELLGAHERLEEPHAEPDHPHELRALDRLDHLEHAIDAVGDRLLHENVHALPCEPERRVQVEGRGDADERRAVAFGGDGLVEAREELGRAELFGNLGASIITRLDHGGRAAAGQHVSQVPLADGAAADDQCGDHCNMSSLSGVSASMARVVLRPRTLANAPGGRPVPGRRIATSAGPRIMPAGRSRAATRLFRATLRMGSSLGVGALTPSPSAASTSRIALISSRSCSGSSDAWWSGPSRVRSRVKCFSMQAAPRPTAATATWIPRVWSESPTGTPNRWR